MFDFLKKKTETKQEVKENKSNPVLEQFSKEYPDDADKTTFYFPATDEEFQVKFKEDMLNEVLESKIKDKYPDIKDLTINIRNYQGHIGHYTQRPIEININITWCDGINPCCMRKLIHDVCGEHFNKLELILEKKYFTWGLYTNRLYSDEVLIIAARKYADCISKELPLNKDNIKCLKLGGVTLDKLARTDLAEQMSV